MALAKMMRCNMVHYEYMALANNTSILREAMVCYVCLNHDLVCKVNSEIVPRRVCGHLLKPCYVYIYIYIYIYI